MTFGDPPQPVAKPSLSLEQVLLFRILQELEIANGGIKTWELGDLTTPE